MTAALVVRKFEGVELCEWENGYVARDTEIAKWLKFERLEKIRDIIRRNAKELNDYGVLTAKVETSGPTGGRPATVYYLNKDQALIVAMLSRAPGAAEVRKLLTRAFDASQLAATDSFIFNKLFLPHAKHTEYLWTPKRLGPIAKLYGIKYEGGRAPLETRNVQRVIYDLLLGHKQLTTLREKYPDPPGSNGEPYIYDHFHPAVRTEFEAHLDRTVLPLARRASSSRDFVNSLRHEYEGRPLQMAFAAPRSLKEKPPPKKKPGKK
jgi:hypothetical protein